jgi:hypothetical protein
MRKWLTLSVALAFGVTPVFARGHSGGHGGHSHSSSGHGHAHGRGSGSHGSGGGHTQGRQSGSPSASATADHRRSVSSNAERSSPAHAARLLTEAERRRPRPGTGTGDRFFGRVGRHFYARPYFGLRYGYRYRGFDPFLYDYGFYGYSPWSYDYRSYDYGPYSSGRRGYDAYDLGALRLIVDPPATRVYVDGDYAGIADDFDGLLQRLRVRAGPHDVTLSLDGYRTRRFQVFVAVGETVKLHYLMVPGHGEDADAALEGPVHDADDDRDVEEAAAVRITVRPSDASIYADDEFRGSGREVQRVHLTAGRHRIEVVRPGYRTVERDIEVRPDDTRSLEITLTPF